MTRLRFWSGLVLVLALGLALDLAAQRFPRPLNLPAARAVLTTNPKIGVHTRLTGISDEAYIQRSLAQVRAMGAPWIVELFPWAYAQPRSRYGYDWAGFDMVISHARRQGLTVVARLDIVPAWARRSGTTDRYLDPTSYADYASYVVAFLQRYAPQGVRHVIIWNEPNLAFEWGQRPPDPGAYAALLKVVYPRVKQAVPEAVVIAGALSPGGPLDGGATRMGDEQFLFALIDAEAGAYFDMWAVHLYGGQSPPDEPPAADRVNLRRVELVHQWMQQLGIGDKPIIITEGGWNDHPRWNAAVRPSERVRWTVAAYEQARGWPYVEALCLWQFSAPFRTGSYPDAWNFVAPDGTPRAIYDAVQAYSRTGTLPP